MGRHRRLCLKSPSVLHMLAQDETGVLAITWEARDPDSKIFQQQDSGLNVRSNLKIPRGILWYHLDGDGGKNREREETSRGEAGMYSQGILIKAHILETEAGVE